MKREISISNRHPRLRIPRAAVARVIGLLDAEFNILPGDLPHLSLPRNRLQNLKSEIANLKLPQAAPACPPANSLSSSSPIPPWPKSTPTSWATPPPPT
ncbi:hypothetical protein Verru16b_02429 [Lacunisphaera limnophila]|uniref:Uncharacterized protein n=1 Tax=Lacunisphaera limnophila TaxID=1838286 RepID=A0A1D8AWT0_9BACT|nr:hypothetical protein [Lacunisphaera limnophila]AOS45348.1 hypothetical protein Verru16b_02429 [Lacunisphaera limnophila]